VPCHTGLFGSYKAAAAGAEILDGEPRESKRARIEHMSADYQATAAAAHFSGIESSTLNRVLVGFWLTSGTLNPTGHTLLRRLKSYIELYTCHSNAYTTHVADNRLISDPLPLG
jgi:hypothetical protein